MQSNAVAKILVRAALAAVIGSGIDAPLHAQEPPQGSGQSSANLDAAKQAAQQINDDMIVIVEKISKADESAPVPGPPSKEKLILDETRQRLEWLKTMQSNLGDAIKKAEHARNPAEAQVLTKDAMLKAEAAEHLKESITGPPISAQPTAAAPSSGSGRSGIHFHSGAFQQLQEANTLSQEAAVKRDPDAAQQRSRESFLEGRAGAGGVTLYKPATVLTPLEPARITNATMENGRLAVLYDSKLLRFPELDAQYLALAIRSVYGGEGLVKGMLLANEDNAVVLRTGKEQYGDVAWKKEFLPQLPQELTVGQQLSLDLGPGVGALDLPDASYERITYYGPIKGTVLGQVVLESDMVFPMFWYGIDWMTGMPLDLSKHPGYQCAIELDLNGPAEDSSPPRKEPAKNWWEETVWFVWSPDEMTLDLDPVSGEFQFVKSTMRVVVWSVQPDNVRTRSKAQGEYITSHFDDFARAFPALARLREAAKAISIVRWLKLNNVPLDQTWATSYSLDKVLTPEKIRRYSVNIVRDKSGKPKVEPSESEGSQ